MQVGDRGRWRRWLRLDADCRLDERREAKTAMLEANPSLRSMYSEDDSVMAVFAMDNCEAVACSFTAPPAAYHF